MKDESAAVVAEPAAPARERVLAVALAEADRRAITWRSVLLGTLSVLLVCGLTPFNDYVVANTFVVGSYLPPVLVLSFFVLIVLVNAPLHRFLPRKALTAGELSVVMVMMLVACAIPSQGLMRGLIPTMVAPFYFGLQHQRYWQAFLELQLPAWLFPVSDYETARTSEVVAWFYSRIPQGNTFDYSVWITPLAGWGIFVAALWATLIALATILLPQWATNERLQFPLAQLQMSLIQPPEKGRALNALFRSRSFWIALGIVFCLQSFTALNRYFPQQVPEIPLKYDLRAVMANEPWTHFSGFVKSATLYFTFIGITYFIQSRIAFSMWSIFLIVQVFTVQLRMVHVEVPNEVWMDQTLGAYVAFTGAMLWVGRHHWAKVLRQTVGLVRKGEERGTIVSYRAAMIVVILGIGVMLAWLSMLGVQWWLAGMIVAFTLMAHVVIARIVAETGLPFIRGYPVVGQVTTNLPIAALSGRDVFFAGAMSLNGVWNTREGLLTYALHGLRVEEEANPAPAPKRGLMALVAFALTLGFVVAAASSLWCYYNYASPITTVRDTTINPDLLGGNLSTSNLLTPLQQYSDGAFPPKRHNPWLHMGTGAIVTLGLSMASWRWTAWPFAPVGFLIHSSWYLQLAWFSIFWGWLAKVLILRFGGARMYKGMRPLFIGMIFGEALAAAAWLIVALLLASMGYDYEPINFLPT